MAAHLLPVHLSLVLQWDSPPPKGCFFQLRKSLCNVMKQLPHIWYKYLKKSFFLSLAERSYRGRTSTERSPGDPLHRDQCNSAVRDQKLPTLHDDRGEDGQRQDGHMENPSKRAQHPAPQGRTGIQHHTCKTFSFISTSVSPSFLWINS